MTYYSLLTHYSLPMNGCVRACVCRVCVCVCVNPCDREWCGGVGPGPHITYAYVSVPTLQRDDGDYDDPTTCDAT